MRRKIFGAVTAGVLTLSGCADMTENERLFAGSFAGATAGLLTAEVLDANDNWTILSALGGAAAGTMVARNRQTQQCAYARGDGTYVTRPCR